MAKPRLDQLLVERGLAESRSRAQALILAGQVFSGDRRLDKPGQPLDPGAPLEVRDRGPGYVSRGGLKLAHALDHFAIDPTGLIALDVGASTGGFTDVLLRRGARRVYAVDVGAGQLDWRLRNDPRVVVLEKTNARHLTRAEVPEPVGLIVCDASFISLRTVLPAPLALAADEARLVALIKPQFEVGKGRVGKGGVVRDPALHEEVCAGIARWLAEDMGWRVAGITPSPITGPAGNVEFLVVAGNRRLTEDESGGEPGGGPVRSNAGPPLPTIIQYKVCSVASLGDRGDRRGGARNQGAPRGHASPDLQTSGCAIRKSAVHRRNPHPLGWPGWYLR